MKKIHILIAFAVCMAFAGCAESADGADSTTAATTGNSVYTTTTAPVSEDNLSDGASVSNSTVITTVPEEYQPGIVPKETGKYYVFTDENGVVLGTGYSASDADELGVGTGGVVGSYVVVTDMNGAVLGTSIDGSFEGIGSGTEADTSDTVTGTNETASGSVESDSTVLSTTPVVTTTPKATTTAPKTTTAITTKTTTATTTLYTEITPKTMYVSSAVNVRSKPDASSTKLGTLAAGKSVKVIGESGNWYAISYNGQTAFVSKNYVSSTKPATTTTTTTKATTTTKKTTTKTTTTSSGGGSGSSSLPYDEATIAFMNEVVRLTNEFRAENGVGPLTINVDLTAVAMVRAEEITEVFDHTRPDGTSAFTAFEEGGFILGKNARRRAENIAYGYSSAAEVVEAWKNSTTGHRENMLREEFNIIGVGVVKKGNVYYWTQEFVNYG